MTWIDWNEFPVPEDVRGLLFLYEDGSVYPDRYSPETKKRKYRDCKIVGWKFMERRNPNEKSIQCNVL